MSVNLSAPDPKMIFPVAGVELGTACAGIRKEGRRDVMVMRFCKGAKAAGVFTQNRFAAAPVRVCREHQTMTREIRALVVNTGVANAGTGEAGINDARLTTQKLAELAQCPVEETLVFSTGVIMEPLPMQKLLPGLEAAWKDLSAQHWLQAAQAIMTTDTVHKAASTKAVVGGKVVTVTGISKGSGMIEPRMATMLGFIATDAAVSGDVLRAIVKRAADASFNRITVDGDTSTNDSFVLVATGASEMACIDSVEDARCEALYEAVATVAGKLARSMIRDGEGATKFITIHVQGALTQSEALKACYAVAHSPLVKTAFFASDPNLGRILAAVGNSRIEDLDSSRVSLWLDDVQVAVNGGRHPDYKEEDGMAVMSKPEIFVRIDLGRGVHSETVWTTDLSHEYVKINAEYRS